MALSSVLIDKRVKDPLAQKRRLILLRLGLAAWSGVFQGALDTDRVVQNAQLETKVSVPGVEALQREEAQLTYGKTKVLELFDVETRRGPRWHS